MYDNDTTIMDENRPQATLIVRQGTQMGMSFPINRNQVIIGREEGLDIILQDAESSRRHTSISWQKGQFVVEDMGSTNGTFVNGVQITTPQVLHTGDGVGIGQTVLVFQAEGGQSQQPSTSQQTVYSAADSAEGVSFLQRKEVQYGLYGCGCLLFFCICALLAVVLWAIMDPASFANFTGLEVFLRVIESYLNMT